MAFLAAAVQLTSTADVQKNLATAEKLVEKAAGRGASLVGLPENFAFMGGTDAERLATAQPADGPIVRGFQDVARRLRITLCLGGFAEQSADPQRPYNTHFVIGPDGGLLGRYRKMHLFDVELPDGSVHKESHHSTAGDEPVTVALPAPLDVTLGLSVCYDLRFPELYRALVTRGARLLLVPAAFTLHTGKDHWEVLLRARAIENLSYVMAPAQYGKHNERRVTWGKAMIIDPWGGVVARCTDRQDVCMAEIDVGYARDLENGLPCLSHRRRELG
ncbi:MAG: carbon-nitrogen hydrolase family protein [Deltaproteobacteria bacterium]|nr:carbon-nitrogen hydrolase family protein [Deltaproteobacteria bacterium]